MLTRLDLDTRPFHGYIDGFWRKLVGPDLSRSTFVDGLIRIYGFECAVEAAAAYTPGFHLMLDLRERSRSGYLAQDLVNLGIGSAQLAQLSPCLVAPFADPAEALGWLYVLERSSSLHEMVKRQVEARLPQSSKGCSYLSAAAGESSQRWNELGRVLDRVACEPNATDRILAGAQDGFRCARDWCSPETRLRSTG
ncbi:MAG: Heme oxygenase [Myxococcales bacterium]|nr:Heme oxygenase [Myxococcales bacterium]